jgi:hypothetical protein
LILSGNRFAIWSTLVGFTAVVDPLGPEPSVLRAQPVIASAAEMTIAPAIINPRDVLIALLSHIGAVDVLTLTTVNQPALPVTEH